MIAQDPALAGPRSPVAASSGAGRAPEARDARAEGRAGDADFDTVMKGRPPRRAIRAEAEAPAEAAASPVALVPGVAVPAAPVPDAPVPDAAAASGTGVPVQLVAPVAATVAAAAGAANAPLLAAAATVSAILGASVGDAATEPAAAAEAETPAAPVVESAAEAAASAEAALAAAAKGEAGDRKAALPVETPAAASGRAEGHRKGHGAGRNADAAIPVAAVAKAAEEAVAVPAAVERGEPVEEAAGTSVKALDAVAPRAPARNAPEPAAPAAGTAGAAAVVASPDALGSDGLALVAGTGMGSGVGDVAGARADAQGMAPGQQAAAVVGQVVVALGKAHEPKIEIRLDPPELGRVHIHLTPSDGGVQAVVAADRPETQDLLRRHADLLARELADAGYAGVDLQFAAGSDTGAREQPREALAGFEEVASVVAPLAGPALAPVQATRLATGGLDIRL